MTNRSSASRRAFLRGLATASAAPLLGLRAADGATYRGSMPTATSPDAPPQPAVLHGYLYFDADEARFVEAAVARLIPADALGPGALEAGCALFIDRQLAGPYGRAERWYMLGPWPKGSEQQGYQSRTAPAPTYRAAIRALDAHCTRAHGRPFRALEAAQQDQLLGAMEKGELALDGADAKAFFALLLQNTVEGFFADPIYGGNRDMVGWKLIGFPGARYDYRDYVARHNERVPLPPVGLLGRAAWKA